MSPTGCPKDQWFRFSGFDWRPELTYDFHGMQDKGRSDRLRRASGAGSYGARTLASIIGNAQFLGGVRRSDVFFGDRIVVTTRNSVYSLWPLGDGTFAVRGGWFEREDAPKIVAVNGCTYGGTAIHQDLIASPGLFLEFGNRVLTTRIQGVEVVRYAESCRAGQAAFAC